MDYENRFVMQKSINWSLLNQGLPIPVSVCEFLKLWDIRAAKNKKSYSKMKENR